MRRMLFMAALFSLVGCGGTDKNQLGLGSGGDGDHSSSGDGDKTEEDAGPMHVKPGGDGDGDEPDSGTAPGGDGDISDDGVLTLTLRDFQLYNAADATTNPDFENVPTTPAPWPDMDIVTDTLGPDKKPVYKNASGGTLTTHGKEKFDQWYRDVPGTNIKVEYPLMLTKGNDGTYSYDSNVSGVPFAPGSPDKMFFPLDDTGMYKTKFGMNGDAHNYAFTAEAHTQFTYNGGETFTYRGDDDVFVYINGKLVINLGGIHDPEMKSVNVDDLGLTKGKTYPLDFFFAERHKGGSNVLFTTTLKLEDVDVL